MKKEVEQVTKRENKLKMKKNGERKEGRRHEKEEEKLDLRMRRKEHGFHEERRERGRRQGGKKENRTTQRYPAKGSRREPTIKKEIDRIPSFLSTP